MFVRPGFSRACEHWVAPETIQFYWTGVSGSSSLKQTEVRYWLSPSATAWGVSHSLPGFFLFFWAWLSLDSKQHEWLPFPMGRIPYCPRTLSKLLCAAQGNGSCWRQVNGELPLWSPSTMIYFTALTLGSFLILYLDLKSLWTPAKYCFAKFKFHLYKAHYDILQKGLPFCCLFAFCFILRGTEGSSRISLEGF